MLPLASDVWVYPQSALLVRSTFHAGFSVFAKLELIYPKNKIWHSRYKGGVSINGQQVQWSAHAKVWCIVPWAAWRWGDDNSGAVFTRARHLSLSWGRLIQSIPPHPTSLRSILILSSHLRLGLPSGLLLSGLPIKALYATLLSPIHATCPAYLSLRDLITRMIFGEEYRA